MNIFHSFPIILSSIFCNSLAIGVTNLVRVTPSICNNNMDLVYCKRLQSLSTPKKRSASSEESRYTEYCKKWTKHFKYYCPSPEIHGQDVIRFCSVYSIVCAVRPPPEPVLPWQQQSPIANDQQVQSKESRDISQSFPLEEDGLQRVVPIVVNQHLHFDSRRPSPIPVPTHTVVPHVDNNISDNDIEPPAPQSELTRRCRMKKRLADRFCFGNLNDLPSRAQRRCKVYLHFCVKKDLTLLERDLRDAGNSLHRSTPVEDPFATSLSLGKKQAWSIKIPGYSKTIPGADGNDILSGKRSNVLEFDKRQADWTNENSVGRFWQNIFKHKSDTKTGEYGIGTAFGSPFFGLNKKSYTAVKAPSPLNPTGSISWGNGDAWGPFWKTGTQTLIDWWKGGLQLADSWSIPIAGITGGFKNTYNFPTTKQIIDFIRKA